MGLLCWVWPMTILFPHPWSRLGIAPLIMSLLAGLSGVIAFRGANTNIRPFREADELVTTGPFRFTRNPMYLGLALILLGARVAPAHTAVPES